MPIKHERTRNGAVHTRFNSSSSSTSPRTRVARFVRKRAAKKIQRYTRKQQTLRRGNAAKAIQRITRNRQSKCAICLENFVNDAAFNLTCGHKFHKTCITSWMKAHDKCPLCKRTILPEIISLARHDRQRTSSSVDDSVGESIRSDDTSDGSDDSDNSFLVSDGTPESYSSEDLRALRWYNRNVRRIH